MSFSLLFKCWLPKNHRFKVDMIITFFLLRTGCFFIFDKFRIFHFTSYQVTKINCLMSFHLYPRAKNNCICWYIGDSWVHVYYMYFLSKCYSIQSISPYTHPPLRTFYHSELKFEVWFLILFFNFNIWWSVKLNTCIIFYFLFTTNSPLRLRFSTHELWRKFGGEGGGLYM